jgi:hypothetical protein
MRDEKAPSQARPERGQPAKKPAPEKGQDSDQSSRTPDTEPPKEKRSDDL